MAIQQVYEMNGSLFFSLYECEEEQCRNGEVPHPFSRKEWEEFYLREVDEQLKLCLVSLEDGY